MFADDTTILYSHKDLSSKIDVVNEELEEVSNWFKANKLSVNASKTNFMVLGTPKMTSTKTHHDFNITLHDTLLERVKFTKFLGVLIDVCLTWNKAVLEPRVPPAFAITYFYNHCNIKFENTSKYVDTLTLFQKT